MSEPRVWEIEGNMVWGRETFHGPEVGHNKRIRVVELDPILDLLRRARGAFPEVAGDHSIHSAWEDEIIALEAEIDALDAADEGDDK